MRLKKFRVTNYRNIIDSGWINVNDVTAFIGQNEAGKSNLFDALYCLNPYLLGAKFNANEDWPVDDWAGKSEASGKIVCNAIFDLEGPEIADLFDEAEISDAEKAVESATAEGNTGEKGEAVTASRSLPEKVLVECSRGYQTKSSFSVINAEELGLDKQLASAWASNNVPKFVLIKDYEMSGTTVELDQLQQRVSNANNNRQALNTEDQAIMVVLDLAQVNLAEIVSKGGTPDGRTQRAYDKRLASRYLTEQFRKLWSQKDVNRPGIAGGLLV